LHPAIDALIPDTVAYGTAGAVADQPPLRGMRGGEYGLTICVGPVLVRLPEMALLSPISFRHLIRKQMTTAGNKPLIRVATIDDAARIGGIARAAYIKYVPRIGREPAPMVADFDAEIAAQRVVVVEVAGEVDGYMIAWPEVIIVVASKFGRTIPTTRA
jgi:hypothetical protein